MSAPPGISYARRPAGHGWRWLVAAFAMFRRYWALWALFTIAWMVLTLITRSVPYVGSFAAAVLKPVFAVGFLAAAWSQERGEPPRLSQLFTGFRSNLYALVPLGLVYWAGMTLALLLTALVDEGVLARWIFYGSVPPDEYLGSIELQHAMLVAVVCALPVIFALWFAPAVVVFDDAGTTVALTASLRAALANWQALLVFGLSLLLFWAVVPGMLYGVCVALFDDRGVVLWLLLSMPIWVSLLTTLFICDYVSYRDVFHPEEALTPE